MTFLRNTTSGFSFIQLSILLTVASLVMVTMLPSTQSTYAKKAASVSKMGTIITALRQYQAATGQLPCPADPTLAMGANNWGRSAANQGATGNCMGGTPAAAYADTTNHIALGMVPVYTLGLSGDYALDGYGRDITYAVDTNSSSCWSASNLAGAISINDNGNSQNVVAVLVSHGQDGYGAWLPLQGSSGTAVRLDNGSTDTNQADNAQVAHGGGLTANTTFASFVASALSNSFDDDVMYSVQWHLNILPSAVGTSTITSPANGNYSSGQTLTFTLTYPVAVTVTGTPRLVLNAIAGGGSIGSGNKAYANYVSGSGTNTLTFQYGVQVSDTASNGISMINPIDLNGGTISFCSPFTTPDLSGVKIGSPCASGYSYCRQVTIDHTKVSNTDQTNFPLLFSGTYSYLATVANSGNVTNANGYDIIFSQDQAGTTKLNFEQESYTASTGAVNYWIKVPTVSHTADTQIYIQYGNASVTTDQSNKTGTWDSNFQAVYHLNGSYNNGTTQNDSTSNAKNLTNNGTVNPNPAGIASYGKGFNSGWASQYIYTGTLPSTVQDNFTVSFWINPPGNGSTMTMLANGVDTTGASGKGYSLQINGTHWKTIYNGGVGTYDSGIVAATSAWTYLTLTRNSGTSQMYVNGVAKGSTWATTPSAPATVFSIGGGNSNGGTITNTGNYHFWLSGNLDEVRLSNTPRSADWIATEYNNQSSPSTFYSIGGASSR